MKILPGVTSPNPYSYSTPSLGQGRVWGNTPSNTAPQGQETPIQDKERSKGEIYRDAINGARPPGELSRQELQELFQLKKRDQEVKQHEMAHIAAGGPYVRGGAHFEYKRGPDGRRYAVAGEVSIDTSPEKDPRATLQKMRTVQRAALAPAHPSAQDRRVAAQAAAKAIKAMVEIMKEAENEKIRSSIQKEGTPQGGGGESSSIIDIYA